MKIESEEKSKYKTKWPKEFERFGKDEKGNIIVPKVQYKIITDELGPCKQASMWINIKDKEYLIKNFTYDGGFTRRCDFIKYNGRANMHICKYNNLIVSYIGNIIFDIDTVKYFFVKFYDKAEGIKTNLEYLATLDEKNKRRRTMGRSQYIKCKQRRRYRRFLEKNGANQGIS